MQRITPLHADHQEVTLADLIDPWRAHLQNYDHAAGTVKKYTQAAQDLLSV